MKQDTGHIKMKVRSFDTKSENYTSVSIISTGTIHALKVYGDAFIPLSDYKLQSSADGETEICMTIKCTSSEFELTTSLK